MRLVKFVRRSIFGFLELPWMVRTVGVSIAVALFCFSEVIIYKILEVFHNSGDIPTVIWTFYSKCHNAILCWPVYWTAEDKNYLELNDGYYFQMFLGWFLVFELICILLAVYKKWYERRKAIKRQWEKKWGVS